MSFIKKALTDLGLLWHSLFYGLRGADSVIRSQKSGGNTISINEEVKPGGVFADMLEEKVTKEVEELRDKHYRVLKEADKYKPEITLTEKVIINEKGEEETILDFNVNKITKKTKEDYIKHPPVFEKEGTKLLLIQDNRHIEKSASFNEYYIPNGLYDYDTTLSIKRSFTPRFEIEKFCTKIVVRTYEDNERAFFDLYFPSMASQFGKIDAIFISNLHSLLESDDKRSDIIDFDEIEWVTEKAWNCEDYRLFKFDDIKFSEINVFDGSFVITFNAHIVSLGKDLTEKFKTKELDEKYAMVAPKGKATDLFAIKRREEQQEKKEIDINNLGNTTLKL